MYNFAQTSSYIFSNQNTYVLFDFDYFYVIWWAKCTMIHMSSLKLRLVGIVSYVCTPYKIVAVLLKCIFKLSVILSHICICTYLKTLSFPKVRYIYSQEILEIFSSEIWPYYGSLFLLIYPEKIPYNFCTGLGRLLLILPLKLFQTF